MGLIKEPHGIDFFVDPRPLTDVEKEALIVFIQKDKIKAMKDKKKSQPTGKRQKKTKAIKMLST